MCYDTIESDSWLFGIVVCNSGISTTILLCGAEQQSFMWVLQFFKYNFIEWLPLLPILLLQFILMLLWCCVISSKILLNDCCSLWHYSWSCILLAAAYYMSFFSYDDFKAPEFCIYNIFEQWWWCLFLLIMLVNIIPVILQWQYEDWMVIATDFCVRLR